MLLHLLVLLPLFLVDFLWNRIIVKPKLSSDCWKMENVIGLMNRIRRVFAVFGDYGDDLTFLPALWNALPTIVVVGGQVCKYINACMRFWEKKGRFDVKR